MRTGGQECAGRVCLRENGRAGEHTAGEKSITRPTYEPRAPHRRSGVRKPF
ncbi:hypothetical protein EASAB2608_00327 [Streptomyces sp. EAS-AB2608]|uniref:Uncharacterized protein n=1 Tax=Streptomyces bangladeshensis TaxID=295352 RepID=A0ABN3BHQ0_9ACTN|nr:hypothetical protein EASAB2608_00327 [Streptomyces sp. EAS-AB2608]CUW32898.1 hypothetical protein TUE45_pSRTUE45c_0266 [Streptomyces reticuli]